MTFLITSIWIISTVTLYYIARRIKKVPAIFSTAIILILIFTVFKIDFGTYKEASSIITYILGPATIAFAYPLYKTFPILKKNLFPVIIGILVSTIIGLTSVTLLSLLLSNDKIFELTMLPKSVTAPVAIELSKIIGGIPALTACFVALTGLFGAMFGHYILKMFKVKNDISIGLAIGSTSHSLGTAKCHEKSELQTAISSVALIFVALISSLIISFFANLF